MTSRYPWIDIAKGVAIVLVVIGHALRGLHPPDIVPDSLLNAIDPRIYAFHMPVFFAISGLFLARTLAAPPSVYIRGRVTRLFWPMLLWTYVFLLAKLVAGDVVNTPITLDGLLISPVPGYLHLWFLWALFVLHMTLLATRPALSSRQFPPWALGLLTVMALVAAQLASEMPHWLRDAAVHAPFLVLGLWGGYIGVDRTISPKARLVTVLVFSVLLGLYPGLPEALKLPVSLILTATFLAALSGLGQAPSERRHVIRGFVLLGQASMAIYLMHTMFSAGTRIVLLKLGHDGLLAHLTLGIAIGILGPLAVHSLTKRSRISGLLGF